MKTCPYCKEDVRDDAIKCRYCQSSLLALPASHVDGNDSERITYVVDRGLLRFAKFASAILAIFLIVGAYLFGFKLESSLERVRDVQEQVTKTSASLKESQIQLEMAKATVTNLKNDVEQVLSAAKATLREINEQKVAAIAMVVSIRDLSPNQQATLRKVESVPSTLSRVGSPGKYWVNAATLRIRFMDGDLKAQNAVREAAREWVQHANLKFKFVQSGDAEIRIAFKEGSGSWSYRGTDALGVDQKDPTMNFGWIDKQTLLHEFGHALGLIEEHQNPTANINWNTELIYRELAGPPNYWPKEMVDNQVLKVFASDEIGPYRQFDSNSIMTMAMPSIWTGGVAIERATGLSESDKALIGRLYPK